MGGEETNHVCYMHHKEKRNQTTPAFNLEEGQQRGCKQLENQHDGGDHRGGRQKREMLPITS